MEVGCTAWGFSRESTFWDAVESVGKLRVKGTELVAIRETDLTEYSTRKPIVIVEFIGSYTYGR